MGIQKRGKSNLKNSFAQSTQGCCKKSNIQLGKLLHQFYKIKSSSQGLRATEHNDFTKLVNKTNYNNNKNNRKSNVNTKNVCTDNVGANE